MKIYFLLAGILCFVLGLVHSVLGEILIFNSKRKKGEIVPAKHTAELKGGHLRIIWATWHLASVFGWCLGAILIKIALIEDGLNLSFSQLIIQYISYSMFAGACLVLFGTKGKHPGWIVILLIGVLLLVGSR